MENFTFYSDEKVRFMIGTHRFESGQQFPAEVTLNYNTIDLGWATREVESMPVFDALTGVYHKAFNPGVIPNGIYWGIIESTIDLVLVNNIFHFRIMDRPNWLFGVF